MAALAALNVTHEYFDNVNLMQVATGKIRQMHLTTVSRKHAAFLAAFVAIHAPGASWRYGGGAPRACILSWLRHQQAQDGGSGVVAALDKVWEHAADGCALAELSDAKLQAWGIDDADVHAAVLQLVARRWGARVKCLNCSGPPGLGGVDGGGAVSNNVPPGAPLGSLYDRWCPKQH